MNRCLAFLLALVFATVTVSSACVAAASDWVSFTLQPERGDGQIHASFRDESRGHGDNNWSTGFLPVRARRTRRGLLSRFRRPAASLCHSPRSGPSRLLGQRRQFPGCRQLQLHRRSCFHPAADQPRHRPPDARAGIWSDGDQRAPRNHRCRRRCALSHSDNRRSDGADGPRREWQLHRRSCACRLSPAHHPRPRRVQGAWGSRRSGSAVLCVPVTAICPPRSSCS